ncbi:hypothetical protein Q8A73_014842 [Channa argus]|nr:hypothetical protein Q8A73_014842 [Channa argus]
MSAVTNQPLPFGRLEREKHIQMIFNAFQNRCGPSPECHSSREHKPYQTLPEQLSGLTPEVKIKNSYMQPPGKPNRSGVEEQRPGGGDFTSMLETVHSVFPGESTALLLEAEDHSYLLLWKCCGPARSCTFRGFDCQGHQIFYFERPLRVDACCLGCCLMEMRAYTPQKHLIGTICQR